MSLPDPHDKDPDYVYIYDFDTRIISTIHAAELAPGMVSARMEGMDEPVWVDSSRLQQNSFQHPPFPEEIRDLLRQIKSALDEVYPQSLEQWEDGFRRDRTPEREIAHWLHLAQVYSRFTAPDEGPLTPERRQDIFRILVGCGISPQEQVLAVTDRGSLSTAEAERIVNAFFEL